jgi:hypothetical protein
VMIYHQYLCATHYSDQRRRWEIASSDELLSCLRLVSGQVTPSSSPRGTVVAQSDSITSASDSGLVIKECTLRESRVFHRERERRLQSLRV